MLRLQVSALDISADGAQIVFGAYVGPQQAIFAVNGDGGGLRQLRDGLTFVQRVAISGDGALVASDVILHDPGPNNEVSVVPFAGGEPESLATGISSGGDRPLQLSADGAQLLVSPNAYLIDTETGAIRQLDIHTPGADVQMSLLVDEMPQAMMDAGARRFLYMIRSARCADGRTCRSNWRRSTSVGSPAPTDP